MKHEASKAFQSTRTYRPLTDSRLMTSCRFFATFRLKCLFTAVFLIFSLVTPCGHVSAEPEAPDSRNNVPTMYVNDRAYGRYEDYPCTTSGGNLYAPLDMFLKFENVTCTSLSEGSFLLENSLTESYISYTSSLKNEIMSGGMRLTITVLTYNGVYYMPVLFTCSVLSLSAERIEYKGKQLLRLKDSSASLGFDELISLYVPPVIPDPPSPPTPPEPMNESSIAITFESFGGEYVSEIFSSCRVHSIRGAFFFTEEELTSMNNASVIVRRILIEGHSAGIYIDITENITAAALEAEINSAQVAFIKATKCRTRLVRFSPALSDAIRSNASLLAVVERYGLTEIAANIQSSDTHLKPSAIIEKLKSEINENQSAIICFSASSSTAEALYLLRDLIDKNSNLALFAPDETTGYGAEA